jgi:hypothetical protein
VKPVLAVLLVCLAIMLGGFRPGAILADGHGDYGEYQVKAAFLYNFAKHTEWPLQAFPNSRSPVRLCILGQDPFGKWLDLIDGKEVGERRLAVLRFARIEETASCQIVFISVSERERFPEILVSLRDQPVLTIGDTPEFAHLEGMISLQTVSQQIRYGINIEAARRAGLTFRPELVKWAEIIGTQGAPRLHLVTGSRG